MKPRIRIHLQLKSKKGSKDWTFDHPEKVTVGFSTSSSICLEEASVDAEHLLFTRRGGELRLRTHEELRGFLTIQNQSLPFESLREVGLLKKDRLGEYVSVRLKTKGSIQFGDSTLLFWVTEAPNAPEFPLHPQLWVLAREIPRTYVICFILASLIEIPFFRYLKSLPPMPEPTLQEVVSRYARIEIPSYEYLKEKSAPPPISETNKPSGKVASAQKKSPPRSDSNRRLPHKMETKGGGFLSAVANSRAGSSASPFSGLFTTESLGSDLEKAMKGTGFEKAVAQRIGEAGGGAGVNTNAPKTRGIGEVKGEAGPSAKVRKETSSAAVARFSIDSVEYVGDIDRNQLEKLVAARSGELRDCYERSLAHDSHLSGKITFRLILKPAGKPNVMLDPSSVLKDPSLVRCAVERISLWPFPTPKQTTEPILLPFVFSTTSKG